MKNESSQKLAKLSLRILVLFCLASLIVLSLLQVIDRGSIPGAFQSFLTALFIGIAVAIFGLHSITRAGFTLSESGLSVGRPFGDHWISYDSITRVERVCRKGSRPGDKVRVSFIHRGVEKSVEITPENPSLLIHDVLTHCPHIYKSKRQKTKRDRSFRAAKGMLTQPRLKSPPVEY